MNRFRQTGTFILALLVAALPAHAQNESTRRAPARPEMPAEPAPSTPAELEAQEPEEMVEMLLLRDESALQVLDLLEQLTGKIILRRQDLSPAKINFNSNGPLTQAEAVLALESLLTLNGIMLTDMGGRFMKAVPATDVNRHAPEMIMGSTLDLAPSQQIYAKLFQLEYLNAEQANGSIISPILSQTSGIVLFPKSNALLITDALVNLQRIERILDEADRPQVVREKIEFVKLDYIQAREMQQQLENLIQGPLNAYLEGSTSVTADERTNQLIVITHPGNLEMIMNVIENVDVDAAPLTRSEVFQLRQAKAEEVVPIIQDIISGQEQGRERDAEVARENNQRNRPNNNQGAENQPPVPTPTANQGVAAPVEGSASLQFSGFVGLSADERTNSIVAYGTDQDLRTLKELIEAIDIPLPQVRIEAIITEVSLSENQASGISSFGFTFDDDASPNLVFGGDSVPTDPDDPSSIVQGVGGIFGTGFAFTGNVNGLINAVLRTAESDSDVRVLSTPTIVVSHNEEGIVNVSESRPIVTSSSSSLDNANTTNVRSNVEFRDIGIQLTVTPLIGKDGSVQMEIEQTVDNVAGTTNIDGNEQPIIGRREATSTITVNSGEVIVLGGLQENRRSDSKGYFPFFGRTPGLRNIFGGSTEDFTRTELIIFVRPTVLMNPSEADDMSAKTLDVIEEGEAIRKYMSTGNTGMIYMEDSHFEAKSEKTEENEATGEAKNDAEAETDTTDAGSFRNSGMRSLDRL